MYGCAGHALSSRRELVVSGLRPLLEDASLTVRAALTQTIIAMATHNYLALEGGQHLVKFIVDMCSLPDVRAVMGGFVFPALIVVTVRCLYVCAL